MSDAIQGGSGVNKQPGGVDHEYIVKGFMIPDDYHHVSNRLC
jgi:hypothetical protein